MAIDRLDRVSDVRGGVVDMNQCDHLTYDRDLEQMVMDSEWDETDLDLS